jgi:hypothetical protein
MPDPLLYLNAVAVAACTSALVALGLSWRRLSSQASAIAACLMAMIGGTVVGYGMMQLWPAWPPLNALDRLLTIVLPAAAVIELISGFECVPRWLGWLLRLSLCGSIGRILLHGSVYLGGTSPEWTGWQAAAALAVSSALLGTPWVLLSRLLQRGPGVSIPLAVALSIVAAGMAIMLGGYVKGGSAALPLSAALVGVTLASRRNTINSGLPAIVAVTLVGLFGLLFIGTFFGRLSMTSALTILLAPLLCWATAVPKLRDQKPWVVGSVRLLLVAMPLAVVLTLAKRNFDRHTAPLLTLTTSQNSVPL